MENLSIIICAYNEEDTISGVVSACCRYNPKAEVVVVDDGSTDGTAAALAALGRSYRFSYERLHENRGKSWAMVHGVLHSERDIVLFFDADVSRITREHFSSLVKPLLEGSADLVLGQPRETMIDYRVNPFKSLTGERAVFRKDILPIMEDIREIKFGVETFINLYYQAEGKRIQYVLLDGLVHPNTFEKISMVAATRKYISEGQEIALTYMEYHNLIIRRIQNRINQANQRTREKLNRLQNNLERKIEEFLEVF